MNNLNIYHQLLSLNSLLRNNCLLRFMIVIHIVIHDLENMYKSYHIIVIRNNYESSETDLENVYIFCEVPLFA